MDEWMTMIEDCERRESKLTAWEVDFISSIRERIEDDKPLTDKQAAQLDKVWDRVTG